MQIKTVEELREYILGGPESSEKAPHRGCHDCVVGRKKPCREITTRSLRNKYTAKYGCICAVSCVKCRDFFACHDNTR